MERRKFMISIAVIPTLFQLVSCKKPYPTAETIVKGRITDEQGEPVQGIRILMRGTKRSGLSKIETFEIQNDSDEDGDYLLSYVVTKETETVTILYKHNEELPFDISSYGLFTINRDGEEIRLPNASGYPLDSKDFGGITTINLQFRKL